MLNINLLAVSLVVIGTITGSFGSLFLKKGAEAFNLNLLKQLRNKNLIFGCLLFIVGTVLYIPALSMEKLSILYPITSLTYIWVALLSVRFLKEEMNLHKWLGITLIIIGIFLISYFSS